MSFPCDGCGAKEASFQCPKCRTLGLPPSYFCQQQCFKDSWNAHKAKHTQPLLKSMPDAARMMFRFAGPIRPGLISPMRAVPPTIARPDYADHREGRSAAEEAVGNSHKTTKWSATQLDGIRKVCRLGREVLDIALLAARPGVTTDEIDRVVHEATVERGAYPSTLNYMTFPKSLCTSVNEVICHGIPDSRVLETGDLLNLDISAYFGGYHGDLNETMFVGRPDAESVRLVHATYTSMMAGIATVQPGALFRHIGDAIQPVVEPEGFGVVRNITAHGIGTLFHCPPTIPHYAGNKAVGIMAEGNVFTIEPMINAGTHKELQWPDNWTITTADGKRSAQFEHTVLCTATGADILTLREGGPFYQQQLCEMGIAPPTLKFEEALLKAKVAVSAEASSEGA